MFWKYHHYNDQLESANNRKLVVATHRGLTENILYDVSNNKSCAYYVQ